VLTDAHTPSVAAWNVYLWNLSSTFSNAMATDLFNRMTGRTFDNISPATLLKFTDL
jgi:hypothetical protein